MRSCLQTGVVFNNGADLPVVAELSNLTHSGPFSAKLISTEAAVIAKVSCGSYDRTATPTCRLVDAGRSTGTRLFPLDGGETAILPADVVALGSN